MQEAEGKHDIIDGDRSQFSLLYTKTSGKDVCALLNSPFFHPTGHVTAFLSTCVFVFAREACFVPPSPSLGRDHSTCGEDYSFTTDGCGIFNVCTNVGERRTHERERARQAQGSLHKSGLGAIEKNNVSFCPARESNRGSSDLNSML